MSKVNGKALRAQWLFFSTPSQSNMGFDWSHDSQDAREVVELTNHILKFKLRVD
jgi:hypothetical protein